jgi:hypothetical protein
MPQLTCDDKPVSDRRSLQETAAAVAAVVAVAAAVWGLARHPPCI